MNNFTRTNQHLLPITFLGDAFSKFRCFSLFFGKLVLKLVEVI